MTPETQLPPGFRLMRFDDVSSTSDEATDVLFSWAAEPEKTIRIGIATAEEARRIDDSLPQIHFTLANLYGAESRWDLASQAARRSVELEPSYSDGYGMLAVTLTHLGRLDEAMSAVEQAKQLNPHFSYIILWVEGRILSLMDRYEEAAVHAGRPGCAAGRWWGCAPCSRRYTREVGHQQHQQHQQQTGHEFVNIH